MFESVKFEHKLDKAAFKTLEPALREDLLNAQFQLIDKKRRSLLVLIHGPDGAGKGAVLNRLYGWLDARKLQTLTFETPDGAERAHPPAWKYWRDLPGYGEIGIMLGSWYQTALVDRALGRLGRSVFTATLEDIRRYEAMLDAEGVSILKLWLYLGADEALTRLKALDKGHYSRPVVRQWTQVDTPKERQRLWTAAEEVVRLTSTPFAPWHVVPAVDGEYRDAMTGTVLLEMLRAIDGEAERPVRAQPLNPAETPAGLPPFSILSTLDLSKKLDEKTYREELNAAQHRITRLTTAAGFEKRGLVVVFEGSDAAGKSSAIMRLRRALDPRRFRVHPVAAPTDEERARPYLWRFWRRVPALGHTAIFDRSWYGRVLVERVEGFCSPQDWGRAYGEINDFEDELSDAGYIVVKFWLAISQEEQARRFAARETIAYKRFKLTPEDWRNREKWPLYEAAVTEMVDRTSTTTAPWTMVEAEDKLYARVKVARTVADRLEAELGR
ncbi:polyphosphate:AMP phosphotransferase [Xanthobacter sp. KR7-225]|uniref:polyphosphate:AMP phosphotransferase n=1 Tax=Xanthobacter sp. KR7-225 TaxID=3156613 RepID=UPI0032B35F10